MKNNELINKFYTAFSENDSQEMIACYHKKIVFQDPAFGKLEVERAGEMWKMLLSQKKEGTSISFNNIITDENTGSADWVAKYTYGKKNRKVINKVSASFKFKDGKIIEHIDSFNLWNWTKQAMGVAGHLLGWSSFMKKKIQKTTNRRLDKFIEKVSI